MDPHEFNMAKEELRFTKSQHENVCKRLEVYKKKIKDFKLNKTIYD